MTPEQKIIYLIREYEQGRYATGDFCNLFSSYFYGEEHNFLHNTHLALENLAQLCARFADNPQDLALKNVYFSEADIRNALAAIPDYDKYNGWLNQQVGFNLSQDEALVLYDLASQINKDDYLPAADGYVQILWLIENSLEQQLVEIFYPDYAELLGQTRQKIIERYGSKPGK